MRAGSTCAPAPRPAATGRPRRTARATPALVAAARRQPFPVADAYRLGVRVVLPNATETMRRYPQFAAGLPFPFGSLYVPVRRRGAHVRGPDRPAPSASDTAEALDGLSTGWSGWRGNSARPWTGWTRTGTPRRSRGTAGRCALRPPPTGRHAPRTGSFAWDPGTGAVTVDEPLCALLGVARPPADPSAPRSAHSPPPWRPTRGTGSPLALRQTAAGRPPPLPLYVRAADGGLLLVELWRPQAAPLVDGPVRGVVRDTSAGAVADAAPTCFRTVCSAWTGWARSSTRIRAPPRLLGQPRARLLGHSVGGRALAGPGGLRGSSPRCAAVPRAGPLPCPAPARRQPADHAAALRGGTGSPSPQTPGRTS